MSMLIEIIKAAYRLVKHLSILLVISLPLQLVGALALLIYLPIAAYRATPENASTMLPLALKWFDCVDSYVGRNTDTYLAVIAQGWWARYCWLAWRNPCNYFGYVILGTILTAPISQTIHTSIESEAVSDGTGGIPGLFYTEVEANGKTYYEYYYIKKYTSFGTPKCLRIRIGYKLGLAKPGDNAEQVFVISPWHSYNGS